MTEMLPKQYCQSWESSWEEITKIIVPRSSDACKLRAVNVKITKTKITDVGY